jgi:phenylalanyl-tRNA synthetase beta subunit
VWGEEPESEQHQLACVWYAKRGGQSFYALKNHVMEVCRIAHITSVWGRDVFPGEDPGSRELGPGSRPGNPFLDATEAAVLLHNDQTIGYFGKLDPVMVQKMGCLPESTIYVATLNGDLLRDNPAPTYQVQPLSKFQSSSFDVSAMMPRTVAVAECERRMAACSSLITNVRLIDFFERKEWTDQRSLAFRLTLGSLERTLTKEEVEAVRQDVIGVVTTLGGELRG